MWLVVASLIFYARWEPSYLPIILGSLAFNFALGSHLIKKDKGIKKSSLLAFGVITNIALLGYFKYTNFIIGNVNLLLSQPLENTNIALPLAISFFTFQQIAYLVDSYRKETKEYDLLNYSLFVTFFPQLIAGPIVHHKEMMPQFNSKWNLTPRSKNISLGLFIFSIGLFKKIAIADTFSIWADAGFYNSATLSFYEAWLTSLSYSFQLYFDFSGYCDMAMGAALLFNIKLPINFNSPYKSLDIQDFWRRWHITLGRFLRDYIYIPLGGSKKKELATYSNLFMTFLIGGLWHGASWMFVIWGALHGMALVLHRMWKSVGGNMPTWLAWLTTFIFINMTWIFFRAENLTTAVNLLSSMSGLNLIDKPIEGIASNKLSWIGTNFDLLFGILPNMVAVNAIPFSVISFSFYLLSKTNSYELLQREVGIGKMISAAFLFAVSIYIIRSSSSSVFLYFNF
jgi:D-alanyl-lipoteichoic acid acyltransferase DltB (MBOAT superfamily)